MVHTLRNFIEANQDGSGLGRMAFIMTSLTDELSEELAEMDELQTRIFLAQIGEVIAWIGHGNNEMLPDGVRAFAETVQPTVRADVSANDSDGNAPIEIGTSAG